MNKREAIESMVERDFSAIPQDWVRIVMEHYGLYEPLPMWGTMWFVDDYIGEKLMEHSRRMVGENEAIDINSIENDKEKKAVKKALKELEKEEIDWAGCSLLEDYVDEEMDGANCVLDKQGNRTAVYVYEVEGEYLIGVQGAGWNFYKGVWDMLYDLLGYQWHEVEQEEDAEAEKQQ